MYRRVTPYHSVKNVNELDEMLTARELRFWLKVGHNYPYVQLRHLALRVGSSKSKSPLRWRKGDILDHLRHVDRSSASLPGRRSFAMTLAPLPSDSTGLVCSTNPHGGHKNGGSSGESGSP